MQNLDYDSLWDLMQPIAQLNLVRTPNRADLPDVIATWLDVFAGTGTTPDELRQAIRQHLTTETSGRYWPQPADLLTIAANRRGAKTDTSVVKPPGCRACLHAGTRTVIQHVWYTDGYSPRPGAPKMNIPRIRMVVAPCDTCALGAQLEGKRGLTWRTMYERRPRPPYRPGVAKVRTFVTGTPHRLERQDADPAGIFYARPSPSEELGPVRVLQGPQAGQYEAQLQRERAEETARAVAAHQAQLDARALAQSTVKTIDPKKVG